ncbi:hypothetical protein PV325_007658 [Microctonus aethiopoides]|nr:hypothetical protein PV325_007658 [Microctonus aethiopoides]
MRFYHSDLLKFGLSRKDTRLFIIPRNNDLRFYHGQRPSTILTSLQQEFRRLSTNCLETLDQQMIEFIRRREGMSIYSLEFTAVQSTSSTAVTEDVDDICMPVCCTINGQKTVIQLNLQMINDRNITITKSGTTIDTAAIAPSTQNVQAIEAPSNIKTEVKWRKIYGKSNVFKSTMMRSRVIVAPNQRFGTQYRPEIDIEEYFDLELALK